ncbi:hypothetical protein GCM10017653_25450 [Ancylobacter defluvii]|uniref:Uncharacterized protein n=1 Tax=Ancylobacter defluvii TaxID=1282440 RepID=A0A9W6NBC7_9HYPH|nr:hypothetical protein GCM10017653_25450 [Ancylobacter defluvii]
MSMPAADKAHWVTRISQTYPCETVRNGSRSMDSSSICAVRNGGPFTAFRMPVGYGINRRGWLHDVVAPPRGLDTERRLAP